MRFIHLQAYLGNDSPIEKVKKCLFFSKSRCMLIFMNHGPNIQTEDFGSEYKTKIGLILFGVYSLFYLGFVLINTFAPRSMETPVFLGINLAVTYGMGLIVLAIVLGLVYNHLSTQKEDALRAEKVAKGGVS